MSEDEFIIATSKSVVTGVRGKYGISDFAWHGTALGYAHTLRQSAFLRGNQASKTVEGLFYAGSTTTPGVGVPMCLISAENAASLAADYLA